MTTSNPIRKARVARRWSQSDLAQAIGVSVSAISDWETGKKVPEPTSAKALIATLPRLTLNQIYANVPAKAA